MKMKLYAAVAALALIVPGTAQAATFVHYVLSGGAFSATWDIDVTTPVGYDAPGVYTGYTDVTGSYTGTSIPTKADIVFFTGIFDGLDIYDPYVAGVPSVIPGTNGLSGAVLFTGTTSAPTLSTGTFTLFDTFNTQYTLTASTVTIPAVVPEPATWALMMAGFGVLAMGLRSRRSQGKLSAGISFA